MKNNILFILILLLFFSFYAEVSASECSINGYSIFTINGILNNKVDAIKNKDKLKSKFRDTYNNQPLNIDYLYNPTHVAGLGDLIDAVQQGLFDQKSDYDLVEMINDASQKVATQKLLLVAHSQGNFYANSFYDKVADKEGGVPGQSIGVYGVATPANRVAGKGKYLTSDTDSVIASTVARFLNILTPNIHIPIQKSDGNGHSFSDVYLKYKGDRLVADIKSSLDRLKENDEQLEESPCISPPELSLAHKATGVLLAVADPTASVVKAGAVVGYKTGEVIRDTGTEVVKMAASGIKTTIIVTYKTGVVIRDKTTQATNALASTIHTIAQSIFNDPKNLGIDNRAAVAAADGEEENPDNSDTQGPASENTEPVAQKPNQETAVITASVSLPVDQNNEVEEDSPTLSPPKVARKSGGGGGSALITETDNTPPVISMVGLGSVTIQAGSVYEDAGATALDDVDGNITANIVVVNPVDASIIGSYIITYNVKDAADNSAVSVTRQVNVVASTPPAAEDTTAPVITVIGDNPASVEVGTSYAELGATATDDVDEEVIVNATGDVEVDTVGTYTVTYTATDAAGNSVTATRTVNVVESEAESTEIFSTFTSDGVFTQDIYFDCTTNILDTKMMYYISDADNSFHRMNGGENGTYCPGGRAHVMGNGQKFTDFTGYVDDAAWYYVSYFSAPNVCFYNSPIDCVFNNPPSIFTRLHRNSAGVWSDSDAEAPPPDNIATQLKIITSPQTISIDAASGVVTVESQNESGELTNVASATSVSLSSDSVTGVFSSASASTGLCGSDWTKTSITISTGDSHRSFCYKDSTAGTPTITVSADDFSSDSQTFTITE